MRQRERKKMGNDQWIETIENTKQNNKLSISIFSLNELVYIFPFRDKVVSLD